MLARAAGDLDALLAGDAPAPGARGPRPAPGPGLTLARDAARDLALALVGRDALAASAGADLAHPQLAAFTELHLDGAAPPRVFALYGLPPAILRTILAHELVHVLQAAGGAVGPGSDRAFLEGVALWCQLRLARRLGLAAWADRLVAHPDPTYARGLAAFEALVAREGERAALGQALRRGRAW